MLALLLMSLSAFSQKVVLNNGDTTVCFTIKQSKFLLKQVYQLEECDTLRKICEIQRAIGDSINLGNRSIIADYKTMMQNDSSIIGLKQYQIDKLTESLKASQKEIRKQKVYKWVAVGTTGLVSAYLGYYVLTHK